jgi:hypothetical protein
MPHPYNQPLQFIAFVLFITVICVTLDHLHHRTGKAIRLKPVPSLWIMEVSLLVVGSALLGAISALALVYAGHLRVSGFLLNNFLPYFALVGVPSIVLLITRELANIPIIARHPPEGGKSGKHRYVYRLRKEWGGDFSFHVKKAKFYDRHTSDMSMVHSTDAILDILCSHLKPGDKLVLATPNRRLNAILRRRVQKYFTLKQVSSPQEWEQSVPPAVGLFMNWLQDWGHPALSRITMQGAKFSL